MLRKRMDVSATARVRVARLLCAVVACAAAAGCSSPAPHPGGEPRAGTPAQEGDREQRLRALQQAEALYLSGRWKEAQTAFEQLTRTYSRNADVWFRLGNVLMKEGSYDDAAAALQNAVSLDPGHGRAALNLALARIAQAQAALDAASARLEANSPERQQAQQLQRQIRTILGAPGG